MNSDCWDNACCSRSGQDRQDARAAGSAAYMVVTSSASFIRTAGFHCLFTHGLQRVSSFLCYLHVQQDPVAVPQVSVSFSVQRMIMDWAARRLRVTVGISASTILI